MSRVAYTALLASLLVSWAAPVVACEVPRYKDDVLERDYPVIVTAKVSNSSLEGLTTWKAAYRVTGTLKGRLSRDVVLKQTYSFQCCNCHPRRMIPILGETYVLYLAPSGGGLYIDGFLRLREARRLDPRVRTQ